LGTILTLLGLGIYQMDWLLQIIMLITFIVLTNPLSSHALARAAHHAGIPLAKTTVVDRLKEDQTPAAEETSCNP
jgi:multicomponent Na+:H+ antiporter subunit G